MNSSLSNQLEHQFAQQTESLQPAHRYVPWVTVNGVHTEKIQNDAQRNLVELICKTYKVKQIKRECSDINDILGFQSTSCVQENVMKNVAIFLFFFFIIKEKHREPFQHDKIV